MTVLEKLAQRIREHGIPAVAETVVNEPDTLEELVLFGLRTLERQSIRTVLPMPAGGPAVPVDGRERAPGLQWTKSQVRRHLSYMRVFRRGVDAHIKLFERIDGLLPDNGVVADVLHHLTPDERKRFNRIAGVKTLAA